MSPEERAKTAIQDIRYWESSGGQTYDELVEAIATAIRAAVAEEREAIAQMAKEAFYSETADVIYDASELVAAIRARGETK